MNSIEAKNKVVKKLSLLFGICFIVIVLFFMVVSNFLNGWTHKGDVLSAVESRYGGDWKIEKYVGRSFFEYDITGLTSGSEDSYQYVVKEKSTGSYLFVMVNVHDDSDITILDYKESYEMYLR